MNTLDVYADETMNRFSHILGSAGDAVLQPLSPHLLHLRLLYSALRGRWDSERSSKCKSKSWMVGRFESTAKLQTQFGFVLGDTEEFKFNRNLNFHLYREIPMNLSFSMSTNWGKSKQHSGLRFAFQRSFRVSSSTQRLIFQIIRLFCRMSSLL